MILAIISQTDYALVGCIWAHCDTNKDIADIMHIKSCR